MHMLPNPHPPMKSLLPSMKNLLPRPPMKSLLKLMKSLPLPNMRNPPPHMRKQLPHMRNQLPMLRAPPHTKLPQKLHQRPHQNLLMQRLQVTLSHRKGTLEGRQALGGRQALEGRVMLVDQMMLVEKMMLLLAAMVGRKLLKIQMLETSHNPSLINHKMQEVDFRNRPFETHK